MEYNISFDRADAEAKSLDIFKRFAETEDCFEAKDLPWNVRSACAYSEAVRSLRVFGADVTADGIYDDGGYERIGYGQTNGHVFVKNGQLYLDELRTALLEIAGIK